MQYSCPALSRPKLQNYAYQIRNALGINNELWFPVEAVLETFHKIIGDTGFYIDYVDDSDLPPGVHAAYYVEENCIKIKDSVYRGACNGNGRDRMTIVHEMSHVFLLKVSGLTFSRRFDDEDIPAYQDPEWQAKCLAGELMVPHYLIGDLNVSEIADKCGVSMEAASYQKSKLK